MTTLIAKCIEIEKEISERKEKITEGMDAMLDDRLEILRKKINSQINRVKKELFSLTDKSKFNYAKAFLKKDLMKMGESIYSNFSEVAEKYIKTEEKNEEYQSIINDTINKIDGWEYQNETNSN